MRKNNTSKNGGVYISMAHLGPENVREKFKGMVKRCADSGFDLAGGQVEVVPTAHYFMGGVVVDTDTRTEMEGLYVAGEDAGGAHGSNRLGGNGVANSTVYGGIAGDVMGRDIRSMSCLRDPDEAVLQAEVERVVYPFTKSSGNIRELRNELQNTMWDEVGVMRTEAGMNRGVRRISEIRSELMNIGVAGGSRAFNLTWHDWLNVSSLCDISEVIAKAGIERENSRGAHYREDFPESGSLEDSYFTLARSHDEGLRLTREPVKFTIVRPGQTILSTEEPDTLVRAAE
jgi:fumarate reductase flavoprotein subunit